MSIIRTGVKNHDDTCQAAEAVFQAATGPGVTQTTAKSAAIAFHRACLASALANGVQPGVFVEALRELGTGGF